MQQMQQVMFAMFDMVQQLLTHTGLVPQQQTSLQGMSAPALAPTPVSAPASALGTVSSPVGISFSALFSPLPQVSLFQSPARPTLTESTRVLPSAVSEQPQQHPSEQSSVQQASQQQTQPEQTTSPSDDDDDDPSHFIAVSRPPAP
jgi:hypothetical protein